MGWHKRFKAMKVGMGYTNSDIAEIIGNTPDSIKSATQPNKEIPRWLKLAIVVYETTSKPETLDTLTKESYKDIHSFIRKRLQFDENLVGQLRYIDSKEMKKEHKRFDMSGYEDRKGQCTIMNTSIVNEFADLGIYDYTSYLFLDFYKGTPTLYLKYFTEDKNLEFDLGGYGTVEIINCILDKTIFSNKPVRRRI